MLGQGRHKFKFKRVVVSYLCVCIVFLVYLEMKVSTSRPFWFVRTKPTSGAFQDLNNLILLDDFYQAANSTHLHTDAEPLGFHCKDILLGDKAEIKRANKYQENMTVRDEMAEFSRLNEELNNCTFFKEQRGYILESVFQDELDFPLAFSILLYKDVDQMESLLRAIYRPHNLYCLHVDSKASQPVKDLTAKLAACLDNVFLASRAVDVQWGWYSVVEPDLICMENLWTRSNKWKYFINLTGQEYPLKTNLELARILNASDGANLISATDMKKQPGVIRKRLKFTYILDGKGEKVIKKLKPFKHGVRWAKGAVHIAASRVFVDYLLHSPVGYQGNPFLQWRPIPDPFFDKAKWWSGCRTHFALTKKGPVSAAIEKMVVLGNLHIKDLTEWVKITSHASEHLFNPLQLSPNLGVPGSYTGKQWSTADDTHIRYKQWDSNKAGSCAGKYFRNICIIGTGDIETIIESDALFVNKFHADYQPLGRRCLEYWHSSKVNREIQTGGQNFLDMYLYNSTDLVKNHLKVPQS